MFKSYLEDGNDICTEKDIVKALSFRDGIAGSTAILVDAKELTGPIVNKHFYCKDVKIRETHEIVWKDDKVLVNASSNVTEPYSIEKKVLDNYFKHDLNVKIEYDFTLLKPPLVISYDNETSQECNETEVISPKAAKYLNALTNSCCNAEGIDDHIKINTEEIIDPPIMFYSPWAKRKGTTNKKFCLEALQKLAELFSIGHKNKKRRISCEKSQEILIQSVIEYNWEQRLIITGPRIKSFFNTSSEKQQQQISSYTSLNIQHFQTRVQEIEEEQLLEELEETAYSLEDIE